MGKHKGEVLGKKRLMAFQQVINEDMAAGRFNSRRREVRTIVSAPAEIANPHNGGFAIEGLEAVRVKSAPAPKPSIAELARGFRTGPVVQYVNPGRVYTQGED